VATILVVDDRMDDRELVAQVLERDGHRVQRADSAAEALDQVHAETPDLVITDVLMEGADGYELVQTLIDEDVVPNMPVVFYSSYFTAGESDQLGEPFSRFGFLAKPADVAGIRRVVATALGVEDAIEPRLAPDTTRVEATLAESRRRSRPVEQHPGAYATSPTAARVLLVDDNADNLILGRIVLERAGHAVAIAPGGAEAVEVAKDFLPDLILLDLHMPPPDGYEAARLLRAEPSLESAVIVAHTASYLAPGDREATLEAGFDGYLVKPILPRTFAAEVAPFLPTRAG
jgi:CheY-like chemotaxis protein